MRKMISVLSVVLMIALNVIACGSATAQGIPQAKAGTLLRKIQDRGKLIVGVKYDLPTFGYLNPQTRQLEGFDPAIAREIAAYIFGDSSKVEFKETVTNNRIPFLKDGSVDLVAATFIVNAERLKEVDFSAVYYVTGGRFLVQRTSSVKSIADLDGKKVGLPKGSVYASTLAKISKAQIVEFENDSAAAKALMDNQVDATTNNDANLYGLALMNPGLKVVGTQYTSEAFGLGVAKNNPELLEVVNVVVKNLKSSGKWKAIWQKEIGDKFGMTTIPEPPGDDWKVSN